LTSIRAYAKVSSMDAKDAAVAPQMNSEPGNPERDKRATYRPAHRSASRDSAPVNLDQLLAERRNGAQT
jgi:hypothetical protein